jgi:hypothetical protein
MVEGLTRILRKKGPILRKFLAWAGLSYGIVVNAKQETVHRQRDCPLMVVVCIHCIKGQMSERTGNTFGV